MICVVSVKLETGCEAVHSIACVGVSRWHRVGRVQSGIPRLWPHPHGVHQRVHDDVPPSIQLPVASQAYGVCSCDDLEGADGER